jgi:predicted phage terminase large subunit-like protein
VARRPNETNPTPGRFYDWFYGNVAESLSPADAEEAARRAAASTHLVPFIQYTNPTYVADGIHRHIGDALDRVVRGDLKRLMLFAPPQIGKSTIVSQFLPPFWLAHHPDLPVALTSYGADLAFRNSRVARDILLTQQFGELFPGINKDSENWRVAEWHIRGLKGFTRAAGVRGPLTGFGFGLGIIDDPFEDWAQAQSETIREAVWQWYLGTFYGRIWEDGSIVLMMTRWHEDDLAARILKQEGRVEEGGAWEVLSYTALSESEDPKDDILGREYGQSCCPTRFSTEYYERTRDVILAGSFIWDAEFMQRPSKPKGTFFKIGRIEIVENVPAEVALVVPPRSPTDMPKIGEVKKGFRRWDMAATEKARGKRDPDFTAGVLMVEHEGIFYWMDLVHERLEPEQAEELVVLTAKVDGRAVKIRMEQEPAASGKAIIAHYTRRLAGFTFEGKTKGGDTLVFANPLATQVNGGNMRMLKAHWNQTALSELATFNKGAHDDIVVSASGAFNDLTEGMTQFREITFLKV